MSHAQPLASGATTTSCCEPCPHHRLVSVHLPIIVAWTTPVPPATVPVSTCYCWSHRTDVSTCSISLANGACAYHLRCTSLDVPKPCISPVSSRQIGLFTARQYGWRFASVINQLLQPRVAHNTLALGEDEFNRVPAQHDHQTLQVRPLLCYAGPSSCSQAQLPGARVCRNWVQRGSLRLSTHAMTFGPLRLSTLCGCLVAFWFAGGTTHIWTRTHGTRCLRV